MRDWSDLLQILDEEIGELEGGAEVREELCGEGIDGDGVFSAVVGQNVDV